MNEWMNFNLSKWAKCLGRSAKENIWSSIFSLILIHFIYIFFFLLRNSNFDVFIIFCVQYLVCKLWTCCMSSLVLYQLDTSQSHLRREDINYKNAPGILVCGRAYAMVIFLDWLLVWEGLAYCLCSLYIALRTLGVYKKQIEQAWRASHKVIFLHGHSPDFLS